MTPEDMDEVQKAESRGLEAVLELVRKAIEGDPAAKRAVAEHLWPYVQKGVRYQLRAMAPDIIDDAQQIAMMAVWLALPTFRGQNKKTGERSTLRSRAVGVAKLQAISSIRAPKSRPVPMADPIQLEALQGSEAPPTLERESLEETFATSLILTHLERQLRVGPWVGKIEPEALTDSEVGVFKSFYGGLASSEAHQAPHSLDSQKRESVLKGIRAKAEAALGSNSGWATFDPSTPDAPSKDAGFQGILWVWLLPEARIRRPGKFKLSNKERECYELTFSSRALSAEEVAQILGIKPNDCHQFLYGARTKAKNARTYIYTKINPDIS